MNKEYILYISVIIFLFCILGFIILPFVYSIYNLNLDDREYITDTSSIQCKNDVVIDNNGGYTVCMMNVTYINGSKFTIYKIFNKDL